MRNGRDQIGSRDDHRQAQEMRRQQDDLAADLLALEKPFEDLLTSSFGAHDRVLHREERLQRQALRAQRMPGADQTREVMREQSLLKEALAG
jgi:hypothetical protein